MTGLPSYSGPYGSTLRAAGSAWPQSTHTPNQYGYQAQPQQSSNFYGQQWPHQPLQFGGGQPQPGPTNASPLNGASSLQAGRSGAAASNGIAQPPGSEQYAYVPTTQPTTSGQWPFRAYEAASDQSYQSPANALQSSHASQSINPADINLASQRQRQLYQPSTQQSNQAARQLSEENNLQLEHRHLDTSAAALSSEQAVQRGISDSSVNQQTDEAAQATAISSTSRSTTGRKRKRTAPDQSPPSTTPRRGLALPSGPNGALPGASDPRQPAAIGRSSTASEQQIASNAISPHQANAQPSGGAIPSGTESRHSTLGIGQPLSNQQSPRGQIPTARAAWSQGPEYGRRRVNGKWLPRTLETPSQPAGVSEAESATAGTDLLTPQQIEALQNANADRQSAVEAQPEAEPGTNDEQGLEPEGEVHQDPPAPNVGDKGPGGYRWQTPTGPDLEEYGRKMNTLPTTIGSYLHYSNKRLKYNPMPSNIDEMRDKLYKVAEPILLNSQQIADYWPHMTNVWMRSVAYDNHENGVAQEAWECRQRRRITSRPRQNGGQGPRHRMSKRQMLENAEPCPMRLRMMYYTKHADTDEDHEIGLMACKCIPEWLYMRRTDKMINVQHNHDIEMLDKFKRSEAVMYFVKKKAEEGNSFSAVANWFHDKYDDVTVQAQFMTKQEVANVAQTWRRANKTFELKTVIGEPTPEEGLKNKCMDLLNTTKPEGLIRALAYVCERLPEVATLATPLLQANQEEHAHGTDEVAPLVEGIDIIPPFPGFPRRRLTPSPPPVPRPQPPPQTVESAGDLQVQQGINLRWQNPAVGGPSPLPPPPQRSEKRRPPPPPVPYHFGRARASPSQAGPPVHPTTAGQPLPPGHRGPVGPTPLHSAPYHAPLPGPQMQMQMGPVPTPAPSHYTHPPAPHMWYGPGAVHYIPPAGPIEGHDVHGRPMYRVTHNHHMSGPPPPPPPPGYQQPPHPPPSGSFFPPPGPPQPQPAPPADMSEDAGTDEQTLRALAQVQADRTFQAPYQAPATHSSAQFSARQSQNGHVESFGQVQPFTPADGEVHGNVDNPRDTGSWRPSWLKPIDKDRGPVIEGDSVVAGASEEAVEKQLQNELGAHAAHVRTSGYDLKMFAARDRMSEPMPRVTSPAKEVKLEPGRETNISAVQMDFVPGNVINTPLPTSRRNQLSPLQEPHSAPEDGEVARPPHNTQASHARLDSNRQPSERRAAEETDATGQPRSQYLAAFKERERTNMPKTHSRTSENQHPLGVAEPTRNRLANSLTPAGSTIADDEEDDNRARFNAQNDDNTILVRQRKRPPAAADDIPRSSPTNAMNAAEMLTRLAQPRPGSSDTRSASTDAEPAADDSHAAGPTPRSRTRPTSPVVLIVTPKRSTKAGREAEPSTGSDASRSRDGTQSPAPEAQHSTTATNSLRLDHSRSPAARSLATPMTASRPGQTPTGFAHSGHTGVRYGRKLPPVALYSISPGEKPTNGAAD